MKEENKKEQIQPQKKNYLKKIVKVIFWFFLGVVCLNLVLYALLSIPLVQQKLIDFAISKVQPIIKTEVSIDKVKLTLFNSMSLEGVYLEDQKKDTLLYVQKLNVKISPWGLIQNKLKINSIELDQAFINVSQDTSDSPFNFQFLLDAFASDSIEEESKDEGMQIIIDNIRVSKSRVDYNILSDTETPGVFNTSHISIRNFNTQLSLPSINTTNLNAEIRSLSLTEQSGFVVKNIGIKVRSKGSDVWTEKAAIELPNSILRLDTLEYNLLSDKFTLAGDVNISPADLNAVVPGLNNLKNNITVSTRASGKLPQVSLDFFDLKYGNETTLKVDAYIENYEQYDKSLLNLNVSQFKTTLQNVQQFAQIADSSFVLPDMVNVIKTIRFNGTVKGNLNDLQIESEAWTDQGAIQLQGQASIKDTTFQNYSANININTQNFNLAPFIGEDVGLKRVSIQTNTRVNSQNGNLSANLQGSIDQLGYNNMQLKDIRFTANYTPNIMEASLNADLPIVNLIAEASMTQDKVPVTKLNIRIKDLTVEEFYQNPSWKNPKLSLNLLAELKGNSIDNIEGVTKIDSLKLWDNNFKFQPGTVKLESFISKGNRYIDLSSFLLDARIDGEYKFSTLPDEFSNIMNQYMPGFFLYNKRIKKYTNNLNLKATVHNTKELSKLLDLPLTIMEPINIQTNINCVDNILKMEWNAPYLKVAENNIKNTNLNIFNTTDAINLNIGSNALLDFGDVFVNLKNIIQADSIQSTLTFNNNTNSELVVDGMLQAFSHFKRMKNGDLVSHVHFTPSNINIGKLMLSFLPATIANKGDQTRIKDLGFLVAGDDKVYNNFVRVNGNISSYKDDTLRISFEEADIHKVLEPFDINHIQAIVDGDINLTNLTDKPEFYTDNLQAHDIVVFGDSLGTLSIESEWNRYQSAINFTATLGDMYDSQVYGIFYPQTEAMNINIDLERLSLRWLQPFMSDMLNRVDGSISSRIALKGNLSEPKANGWLGFNDVYMGVDFTNVTYHISDTIKVFEDKIGFRNLIVEDDYKNKANVSALVDYSNLDNLSFLLGLELDNFIVLNTALRTDSLYYGNLFASGSVKVKGDMNNVNVQMNIRNEKNSSMNITIPETSEASTYQSIVYINTPDADSTDVLRPISQSLPINLGMDLTLNRYLNLGVIMHSSNPINMQMNGEGLIKYKYDMVTDNMNVFGDYTINNGTVKIRPQNIKTLEFKIKNGSKLRFVGDPMKTAFNINAYFRVNASLSSLDANFSRAKIPVDCVLGINGSIDQMNLTYDVSLPDADDNTQQRVKALISTDDEKIKQFGNLILFNTFHSRSGEDGSGINTMSILSNTLSGGLNTLFNNIIGNSNWQIGANIESSDENFADAATVNVSTKLLDDKLTLNTNLGYRSDLSTTSQTTFVGDFDIAYELSRMIRLRVYNKTNDRFYNRADMTQGIGIVYTKEAKTLKRLFKFFNSKNNDSN